MGRSHSKPKVVPQVATLEKSELRMVPSRDSSIQSRSSRLNSDKKNVSINDVRASPSNTQELSQRVNKLKSGTVRSSPVSSSKNKIRLKKQEKRKEKSKEMPSPSKNPYVEKKKIFVGLPVSRKRWKRSYKVNPWPICEHRGSKEDRWIHYTCPLVYRHILFHNKNNYCRNQ